MWRKIGDMMVVNRSTKLAGYDTLRVAPAVIEGTLRYIIFDTRSPAKIVACFGDELRESNSAIVSAALEKVDKCRWEEVCGLNGAAWHVTFPTIPFNRGRLLNVRLAPCVTDAGMPGIALYDLEGALLFMAHSDNYLAIREDKSHCRKTLYSLLMELYYLDWQFSEDD